MNDIDNQILYTVQFRYNVASNNVIQFLLKSNDEARLSDMQVKCRLEPEGKMKNCGLLTTEICQLAMVKITCCDHINR